jgi:hypothetical protein
VIPALRYVAIAALASVAGVVTVAPAFADSINLLRPAAKPLSPSIMIDTIKKSAAEDDASASIDQDCVVLSDRTSSAVKDSTRFNFGQLAWSWDESDAAAVIYILCVDPKREPSLIGGVGGGGTGMTAAWPWPVAQPADRGGPSATFDTLASNNDRAPFTVIPIPGAATTATDATASSRPTESTASFFESDADAMSNISFSDLLVSSTIGSSSGVLGDTGFGSGAGFVAGGHEGSLFDPPIELVPEEMAPVPEPGTWLLLGTGLAAAWRARRQT